MTFQLLPLPFQAGNGCKDRFERILIAFRLCFFQFYCRAASRASTPASSPSVLFNSLSGFIVCRGLKFGWLEFIFQEIQYPPLKWRVVDGEFICSF